MGVHTSFYVGAKAHFRPTPEQMGALITDLLKQNFVKMPCAIIVGKEMSLDVPPDLGSDLFRARNDWPVKCPYSPDYFFEEENQKPEDVLVYYAGWSEQTLLEILRELDSETKDICIFFSGFTLDHRQIQRASEVYIFSLAQPHPLVCVNAYQPEKESAGEKHFLQYVINMTGKYGIWQIDGTPLEPILIHHLGPDLIVDCTFA